MMNKSLLIKYHGLLTVFFLAVQMVINFKRLFLVFNLLISYNLTSF